MFFSASFWLKSWVCVVHIPFWTNLCYSWSCKTLLRLLFWLVQEDSLFFHLKSFLKLTLKVYKVSPCICMFVLCFKNKYCDQQNTFSSVIYLSILFVCLQTLLDFYNITPCWWQVNADSINCILSEAYKFAFSKLFHVCNQFM